MPTSQTTGSGPAPGLVCPQCHAPVGPAATTCPQCGVDLALAAALAERQALVSIPTEARAPYVADVILPRFGEFLLNNHYITEAQLQTALSRQRELAARGQQPTVGQILLDMDVITREQLDLASIQQVQQLQSALQESNRQLEQRVAERTQELQQALQRLTELNQLKANFVSNISHELRTPLAQVKGYNALLEDGSLGPLSEDQHNALQVSLRAVERLERLINDLIQFAVSARGEMMINAAAISVGDLAQRVLEISAPKAAKAGLQIRSDVPAALPTILADGEKIHWVLFQLMDNAIKFTPRGGAVMLAAEVRDRAVRLAVRDTGIGIPAERMGELFEPFHQLDGSATRSFGGTGLGLALVKRIVEAHDSRIEIQSVPGRGSEFAFRLPIAMS